MTRMAHDKLKEGIEGFSKAIEDLETMMTNVSVRSASQPQRDANLDTQQTRNAQDPANQARFFFRVTDFLGVLFWHVKSLPCL